MKAWQILSNLELIKGCLFEYEGKLRSNEVSKSNLIGCCALGAVRLAYGGIESPDRLLAHIIQQVRLKGFKNIIEFGDHSSKEEVINFFREIDV